MTARPIAVGGLYYKSVEAVKNDDRRTDPVHAF